MSLNLLISHINYVSILLPLFQSYTRKLLKFLRVVHRPGTQAVVQHVGEHQDSSTRCHLLAPVFASK